MDPRLRALIVALEPEPIRLYAQAHHQLPNRLQPQVWTLLTESVIENRCQSDEYHSMPEPLYEALEPLFDKCEVSPWYTLWALKKVFDRDPLKHDLVARRDTRLFNRLDRVAYGLISKIPLDMRAQNVEEDYDDGIQKTTMTSMMMALEYLDAGHSTMEALYIFGERFSTEELCSGWASEAVSMMTASVYLLDPESLKDRTVAAYFNHVFSLESIRSQASNRRIGKAVNGGTLLHLVCNHADNEEDLLTRIQFLIHIMHVNPALCDDSGLTPQEILVKRRLPSAILDQAIQLLREDPFNYHHTRTLDEIKALNVMIRATRGSDIPSHEVCRGLMRGMYRA